MSTISMQGGNPWDYQGSPYPGNTRPYGMGTPPYAGTPPYVPQRQGTNPWVKQGVKVGGDILSQILAKNFNAPWIKNIPGVLMNPANIKNDLSLATGLSKATTGAGSTLSNVLGKALPVAGAGLGIYNMIQNKGTMSNILSGAGTGASIGSIVPGIGTAIGAGIGALAGGVESLFNIGKPSQDELNARDMKKKLFGSMGVQADTGHDYQDMLAKLDPYFQKAGWNGDQASRLMSELLDTRNTANYQNNTLPTLQALLAGRAAPEAPTRKLPFSNKEIPLY